MMDARRIAHIHALARVPEHSVAFMRAMSQGKAFTHEDYLFFTSKGWLMAIGYPLDGAFDPAAFDAALSAAIAKTTPRDCWAIAPRLPERLTPNQTDTDTYYTLALDKGVPTALERHVRKAATLLRVDEGREFTPEHRKLWAEFLNRAKLPIAVRELFSRTGQVLNAPETDLRLLNAWDGEGRLSASLLLDYAPERFVSYLLGAHSRQHYVPHAADLLFSVMFGNAAQAGKNFIHLGLGVNQGITRFKRKWGGVAAIPYRMASWQEEPVQREEDTRPEALAKSLFMQMTAKPNARPEADPVLDGRRFAMLWELEKNGRRSWIGGTAHTSRYSFAASFRKLFAKVDTVIFEGPLDADSFALVEQAGRLPLPGTPRVAPLLSEQEIKILERVVRGPEGKLARFLNTQNEQAADVRYLLAHTAPWYAFFSLWNAFLERHDWIYSVDLEACTLAREMGKTIVAMERIEDQIKSLEAVPLDRIVRFLQSCRHWDEFRKRNAATYLSGDLDNMMGSGAEFPTRVEQVIDVRDQHFLDQMRPYLEKGRCAAFVGTAHMLNLRRMLAEDGFTVRGPKVSLLRNLSCRYLGC